MTVRRRSLLAGLAAGAALARPAFAQTFPSRPIRLVVGYSPGGGNDLIARIVATRLQESMGQTVLVDNKPGRSRSSPPSWSPRRRPTATRCWSRRAGR